MVWLTVSDVAKQLRVSLATVYRLIDSGELRRGRVSNAIRISQADLAAFLRGDGRGRNFLVARTEHPPEVRRQRSHRGRVGFKVDVRERGVEQGTEPLAARAACVAVGHYLDQR